MYNLKLETVSSSWISILYIGQFLFYTIKLYFLRQYYDAMRQNIWDSSRANQKKKVKVGPSVEQICIF